MMTTTKPAQPAALATTTSDYTRALEPTDMSSAFKVAAMCAKIGICGVTSPEDALVRIMAGREEGLSTIQALRLVYVVNGRPSFDAGYLVSKCQNHPDCEYFEPVESTDQKATYRTKRKGRSEFVMSYTVADAERDGLVKKGGNWATARPDMLRARCSSKLARAYWQDAVSGVMSRDEAEVVYITPSAIVVPSAPPSEPAAEVSQAPVRDFQTEAEGMKQGILDAKTPDELRGCRDAIKAWDGPADLVAELKSFYGLTHPSKKPAAEAEAAQ